MSSTRCQINEVIQIIFLSTIKILCRLKNINETIVDAKTELSSKQKKTAKNGPKM